LYFPEDLSVTRSTVIAKVVSNKSFWIHYPDDNTQS